MSPSFSNMLTGHSSDYIEFEYERGEYIVVYKDGSSRERLDGIAGRGQTLGLAIENLLKNIMQDETDDDSSTDM